MVSIIVLTDYNLPTDYLCGRACPWCMLYYPFFLVHTATERSESIIDDNNICVGKCIANGYNVYYINEM